jgi:hypothetical protein
MAQKICFPIMIMKCSSFQSSSFRRPTQRPHQLEVTFGLRGFSEVLPPVIPDVLVVLSKVDARGASASQ